MICMSKLAPKGIFEEEEYRICPYEEEVHERRHDDYSRNIEDAA